MSNQLDNQIIHEFNCQRSLWWAAAEAHFPHRQYGDRFLNSSSSLPKQRSWIKRQKRREFNFLVHAFLRGLQQKNCFCFPCQSQWKSGILGFVNFSRISERVISYRPNQIWSMAKNRIFKIKFGLEFRSRLQFSLGLHSDLFWLEVNGLI